MPDSAQPRQSLMVVGAVIGAIIGAIDALDTAAGGFAAPLGAGGTAEFAVIAIVLHAAFGVLFGGAAALVAAVPVWWRWRVSTSWLVMAAGAFVLLSLAAAVPFFLGAFPWGVPVWWLGIGFGVPFVVFVLAFARLSRERTWAMAVVWFAYFSALYFLEARVVYQFSKQGLVYVAHTLGYAILYVTGLVGVYQVAVRARRALPGPSGRVAIGAAAVAVVALLAARPVLAGASDQLRLTLHGRTSLTYRLLELLPGGRLDVASAAARFDCASVPALARDDVAPVPASAPRARGVVLVVIDTLRNDRVGDYQRAGAPLTPRLVELARTGVRFDRAYTTSPSTSRAMRSMVTGILNTGIADDFAGRDSIGALLKAEGVWTVAVSAHRNIFRSVYMFDRYIEIERGESNRVSVTAHESTAAVVEQLDLLPPDRPFFIMAHYYDPHAHYVANDLFHFGDSEEARYDAEIAYVDHYVGRLLDALAERGMSDVAVMVVADHGDEFWEHRYRRHLLHLYEESVHVPLILHVPGGVRGARVGTPVTLADIAPTVMDLLGLAVPAAMEGTSLVPAIDGKPVPRRPIPITQYYEDAYALVNGDHKVIINFDTGVVEHYDLAADPNEALNLSDENRPELEPMACELLSWLSR